MSTVTTAPMSISWQLKVVMAKRDITSKELAEKTGLAYGTITKLRNQGPSRIDIDTLDALCKALKCTPGDLMEYEENQK